MYRLFYQQRRLIIVIAALALLAAWKPAVDALGDLIPLKNSTSAAVGDICPYFDQPSQGVYTRYISGDDIAPLTLKTSSGSDYFVKLEDITTGRTHLTFFIHGGSELTTRVPAGSFVLKYATGTKWCGEAILFGSTTVTNKADRIFNFREGRAYTVELISQKGGNLRTQTISRSDF